MTSNTASPILWLLLLMLCFNSGCNNDSDNATHPIGTCRGNERACFGTQTCDADTGLCVPKTCDKDPNVCYETEKCNAKGECQAKSCIDDPRICYGTQSCDQTTGECVHKTCDIDPNVCDENEICNTETKKCMAKSCLDDPNICTDGKKCDSKGNCINTCLNDPSICEENERCTLAGKCEPVKSCTDDTTACGNDYLCEDGECYTIDKTYHTADIPAFCNDKATIQFLVDNYEYIFNLLDELKQSHDNSGSQTDACDAYLELETLFSEKGPQLCKQLLSCSVGSTRSFMICTTNFIKESFKRGSIKGYIKSLNINLDLINNLEEVDAVFTNNYKLLHILLFERINGVKDKSICHTCTYNPLLCKQNETCENNNCINNVTNLPQYCKSQTIIKFFLDHYELYHDLMSGTPDFKTNAYSKLISLYDLKLDDICRQMGDDCLYIDNETMNNCAYNIIKSIILDDNLSQYLIDIALQHEDIQLLKYEPYLCSLYKDDCTAIVTANIDAFSAAINDELSTSFTCDDKPSLCSDDNACRYSECLDNKLTPLYCNYQSMRWFLLDHFNLFDDIAGDDDEVACNSYNQFIDIVNTEGKQVCRITLGCETGNIANIMECARELFSKLVVKRGLNKYLNEYAPGYDQKKASTLKTDFGNKQYNSSFISRLRSYDTRCTN